MAKLRNLEGQRFGRLLVLRHAPTTGRSATYWLCRCDCGAEKEIRSQSLSSTATSSCGCLRKERVAIAKRKGKGESGFRSLYNSYRTRAKWRRLEFGLLPGQFRGLVSLHCVYCGAEPASVRTVKRSRYSPGAQEHSAFVYNGLDRVDSQIGYVPGNVVACCARCNYAKNDMPVEEFVKHIERIYLHQQSRES